MDFTQDVFPINSKKQLNLLREMLQKYSFYTKLFECPLFTILTVKENYSRFQKRELLGKYLLLLAKYIYQALRAVPALFFFIFLIFQHQFSNVFYIQCRIVISINFNSTALTFIVSF